MKNDLLKSLALKAKNRLINKQGQNICQNEYSIKVIKSGDQDFYDRARRLLESNVDLTNPIKELMDEELLALMSQREKEKYLLETIDKYQKFRNTFACEKDLKLVY